MFDGVLFEKLPKIELEQRNEQGRRYKFNNLGLIYRSLLARLMNVLIASGPIKDVVDGVMYVLCSSTVINRNKPLKSPCYVVLPVKTCTLST